MGNYPTLSLFSLTGDSVHVLGVVVMFNPSDRNGDS